MIVARSGNFVFIGLSAKNVELLMEGKPIMSDAFADVVPEIKIAIFYGRTEDAMREELKELIGPATVVIDRMKK